MTTFQDELSRWGPRVGTVAAPSVPEAEQYCQRLATAHYENFPVVSWLLPRHLRQHFYNVYAYCRWADDLADEIANPAASLELLNWWKEQLAECYAGRARHPVFVALGSTIREFTIPMQPFTDLISAFEQDQRVREYESFEQVLDYCARSANPVGRLVLHLGREYSFPNAELSDSICTGLQLANFWQDVRRDAEMGRVYLPREDRQRFAYADSDFERRVTNPAFVELMRFEVGRAGDYLRRGLPLVETLPGWLQVDIDLFARGGLRILERIEKIGYQVWDQRPKVTRWDFARLFLGSAWRRIWRR